MENSIQSIALDKLIAHPDNPNRMSRPVFAKLVRNIKRTGRYEPLVVRPCPDVSGDKDDGLETIGDEHRDCFQIINGHHRCRALAELGYETADVVVWDIDDEQADIYLATLNRLGGSDELDKKLKLLKRLSKTFVPGRLAKLLPQTAGQIERLTKLKMPSVSANTTTKCFANPLVFFLNDKQQQIVEEALLPAEQKQNEKTKAARRAAALTHIAHSFIDTSKQTGQSRRAT